MKLGELDLHLAGEGRHERIYERLGAHVVEDGTSFAVWAPNARKLSVVGDWNGWDGSVDRLEPQGSSGIWAAVVPAAEEGHRYKFEVHGADGKVNALSYKDRATGDVHRLDLEGLFVQIGLLPNTDWLKGTVALSPRGEIVVDDRGQTSVAGVFAAGDATTVPYKQIIIAMGEGSKAALSAFDHLIRVPVDAAGEAAAA